MSIEITLEHECSPVHLLHIFRTTFNNNTYRELRHCGINANQQLFIIIVNLTEV